MKPRTLVTDRLYFGLDPMKLRAATGRALARVVGLSAERARISSTNLRQDFALNTTQGYALVSEFVAEGLLEPPNARSPGYGLTREFVALAAARVVDPLPRSRAKLILTEACMLAERINDDAIHNPLAIDAFVVYGDYVRRAHRLEELSIGVVIGLRTPSRRMRFGRMQTKAEGADAIRTAFGQLSSFIRVRLVTEIRTLPRPFSLVFDNRPNLR